VRQVGGQAGDDLIVRDGDSAPDTFGRGSEILHPLDLHDVEVNPPKRDKSDLTHFSPAIRSRQMP